MGGEKAVREIKKVDPDVKAVDGKRILQRPVMLDHERRGFVAAVSKPNGVDNLSRLQQRIMAGKHG